MPVAALTKAPAKGLILPPATNQSVIGGSKNVVVVATLLIGARPAPSVPDVNLQVISVKGQINAPGYRVLPGNTATAAPVCLTPGQGRHRAQVTIMSLLLAIVAHQRENAKLRTSGQTPDSPKGMPRVHVPKSTCVTQVIIAVWFHCATPLVAGRHRSSRRLPPPRRPHPHRLPLQWRPPSASR